MAKVRPATKCLRPGTRYQDERKLMADSHAGEDRLANKDAKRLIAENTRLQQELEAALKSEAAEIAAAGELKARIFDMGQQQQRQLEQIAAREDALALAAAREDNLEKRLAWAEGEVIAKQGGPPVCRSRGRSRPPSAARLAEQPRVTQAVQGVRRPNEGAHALPRHPDAFLQRQRRPQGPPPGAELRVRAGRPGGHPGPPPPATTATGRGRSARTRRRSPPRPPAAVPARRRSRACGCSRGPGR